MMKMSAFFRLREVRATASDLADQLTDSERKLGAHKREVQTMCGAIRSLVATLPNKQGPIDFVVRKLTAHYRETVA